MSVNRPYGSAFFLAKSLSCALIVCAAIYNVASSYRAAVSNGFSTEGGAASTSKDMIVFLRSKKLPLYQFSSPDADVTESQG